MFVKETNSFRKLLFRILKKQSEEQYNKEKYDTSNPFCRILLGTKEADIVHEDDLTVAFNCVPGRTAKHMLVIPKFPAKDLTDLTIVAPSEYQLGVLNTIQTVVKKFGLTRQETLKNSVSEWGYRVVFNTGPYSNGTVRHCHAHIMGGEQMLPHFTALTERDLWKIKSENKEPEQAQPASKIADHKPSGPFFKIMMPNSNQR